MWWWLLACQGADPEAVPAVDTGLPELELPAVADLPEVADPPEALRTWSEGRTVDAAGWWSTRRPELTVLFSHYAYGWSAPLVSATEVVELERDAVPGGVRVQLAAMAGDRPFTLVVWLPEGPGPHRVLLGLNKCGNRTVRADEALIDGGGWVEDSCDPGSGSRSSYWDIDAALAAGVGVATVHQSDFAPDDKVETGGMLAWDLPRAGDDDRWGAIGAWAWGMSRALDVLETVDEVGGVFAFGHSRRGKTALWTAAQDTRYAGVWAHQSGQGGAALTRHVEGETIEAVNLLFPHWFDDVYPQFADHETRLPFDQHLLLAMVAPRPLRVTDGSDDWWADPEGAEMSVGLAAPVFALLGGPPPTWSLRPGEHEVLAEDWAGTLSWMESL